MPVRALAPLTPRPEAPAADETLSPRPKSKAESAFAAERANHLSELGADRWLAAGASGRGVKVAVLDSGLRGYKDQLGKALPAKVTAPEMQITKDTKEFAFKVTTDKTSPAGQHKNLFCQLLITQNGEPVLHNVGGSELRIDVPLPAKPEAPKAAAPAVAQKAEAPKPPMQKRLTRLEQLRLEQEEREKTSKEKK